MDRRTFNASIAAALACTALPKVNNAVIDTSFEYGIKDVTWLQQFVYDNSNNYHIYDEPQSDLIITFYLDAKCTKEQTLEFTGTSFEIHNMGDDLNICRNGNRLYYEMRELNIFKLGTKIKVNAHEVSKGESYDIELVSSGEGRIMSCFFYNYKLENIVNS
jgi:hypothetical protein